MKILAELTQEWFKPTPEQEATLDKLQNRFSIEANSTFDGISITASISTDRWGFACLTFIETSGKIYTVDQVLNHFVKVIKSITKEHGIIGVSVGKQYKDGDWLFQDIKVMFLFGGNYKSRFKEASTKAYGAFVPTKQKEI